jgi:hypothetical protein
VLLVVVIVVVIHIVVVAATPLRFFKFFATLARLSAFLAVAVHGVTQLILRLVNTFFTLFVSLVSGCPANAEVRIKHYPHLGAPGIHTTLHHLFILYAEGRSD